MSAKNALKKGDSSSVYKPFFLGFALLLPLILMAYFIPRTSVLETQVLFFVAFVAYYLFSKNPGEGYFYWGVLARLILILATPWLSDDYFRFLWDGYLLTHGINPFLHTPNELAGMFIGADPDTLHYANRLLDGMNSPNYYSVYPPIGQWVYAAAANVGHLMKGILVMKLVVLLGEVGVYWVLNKLCSRYGIASSAIAWYWLNPLVILELSGNLHFEGIMLFFLLLSMYQMAKLKVKEGALYYGFSVLSKVFSLMFAPLLFLKLYKAKRLTFLLLSTFCVVICFMPFLADGALLKMLSSYDLYFQSFEFNSAFHSITRSISFRVVGYDQIQSIGPITGVLSMLIILLISWYYRFRNRLNMFKAFILINTVYLLFSPIVHPWYVIMMVAFSVLASFRYPIYWSALAFLSYVFYQENGVVENKLVLAIEYGVLLILVYKELKPLHSWRKVRAAFS